MKLNMFRATHSPSSGAQNCTTSLWFCIRERLLHVEVASNNLNIQQPFTYAKPDAANAVLSSWWWAVCRPKRGASYKHGIINFDTLLHLVGYFCMNCLIHHFQGKGVAGYYSFPDIRILCLMCILVHLARSRTDLTQFVTWYPVLFFLLHFKFPFHYYLHNKLHLKKQNTNI